MKSGRSPLVAAQYLTSGNGGIAVVARLTLGSLAEQGRAAGLACMDSGAFTVEGGPTRGCGGSRLRFVAALRGEAARASAVFYDFAGTARAQPLLWPAKPRSAVWIHGEEVWDRPRAVHIEALRRADLVLVNSCYTFERAAALVGSFAQARLCELATETDDPPESIGPHFDPPTALLLGRVDIGFPKGHDILVDIWPKVISAVPGARLLFAGGGEGYPALLDLIARSPTAAAIEAPGFVAPSALEAVWRRATMMAMPSRGEGFGLVFIEAMRRGLPIVASTEDAGATVNADGVSGYNVSRDARGRLVETMVALLGDRELSRRLGQAGHALWRDRYRRRHFRDRFAQAISGFL